MGKPRLQSSLIRVFGHYLRIAVMNFRVCIARRPPALLSLMVVRGHPYLKLGQSARDRSANSI